MNQTLKTLLKSFTLVVLAATTIQPAFAHTRGGDPMYALHARLPAGDRCGSQTLTGWEPTIDRFLAGDGIGDAVNDAYFNASTGIFTAPHVGVYQISASARIKEGGVGDFTIHKNNYIEEEVIAAFGSRGPHDISDGWSSHSVTRIVKMAEGATVFIQLQNTGATDCIEETEWGYAHINIHLISPR